MKPNQRADGARQCVFCEFPPADPIHVNWERGSSHPFWADGARETIPGKEEEAPTKSISSCGIATWTCKKCGEPEHVTCPMCGDYCDLNISRATLGTRRSEWRAKIANVFYKAGYDAGSSRVAALTEKAYSDGLAEGRRTYQTDLAELARRNEELESVASKLVSAMETCHDCKGLVLVEEGPIHCEDCSPDCEAHKGPECKPLQALHIRLKALLEKRTQPT